MPNKKIVIVSCKKVKDGYGKNGKPWTLYSIVDENKDRYSSFSPIYESLIGTEVEIEYEEKQNGKFTNRTILEGGRKKEAPAKTNEGTTLLKEISGKLDTIIDLLDRKKDAKNEPF